MCLVSEDAYFQSNTSAIVFKAESLDPDRKVRRRLKLIAGGKSEFDRIADMRPFVRRRQRGLIQKGSHVADLTQLKKQ